uniref:Maltose O-acetyltransferase n=1 Tax=uncultured bacterium Contig575 TaxID=1393592 RepID=W0FI09_9BACT|nr:maltose O-acetyltransferase [uncultured bacterium Contig575]
MKRKSGFHEEDIEMTEKEKMLAGQLYDPSDAELTALRVKARKLARCYNQTDEDEHEKQQELLRELLSNSAEMPGLQAPIYFDYGCNTTFGKFSGANFNFTCLDVCLVHIGDNVMIGPNVTLATPMHPLLQEERNVRQDKNGRYYNLEYAKPIIIEDNCWLASNVVVCGGVTIGEGCVIGAGSVVTRDIPSHSLAAGNPCRVIRALTASDRMKP